MVVHHGFMDGRNPGSGEEKEARIRQLTQGPPEFAQAARQAARQPIRQFRAVVQTLPPGKYWLTMTRQWSPQVLKSHSQTPQVAIGFDG